MAFKPESRGSAFTTEWHPKIASTTIADNALMYADLSGAVQPADATSGNHIGVSQQAFASSDATNNPMPLLVPISLNALWRVDVGTGTLTTAMVDGYYDLKDSVSIDVSAQSKNVVIIKRFISATVAVVSINAMATTVNVATT